jgi:hypothetical protein
MVEKKSSIEILRTKISDWLGVIIAASTVLIAVVHEISIKTFFICILFTSIFVFIRLRKWKINPKGQYLSDDERRVTLWMVAIRKFLLFISIVFLISALAVKELNTYLPIWHKGVILNYLDEERDVNRLKPYKVSVDTLTKYSQVYNEQGPLLMVKKSADFYFFSNAKITGDIIQTAKDKLDDFAITVATIFIFVSFAFVGFDYLAHATYNKTNG